MIKSTRHYYLLPCIITRGFHASSFLLGYDLKKNLSDCYFVLRITEDSDDVELRAAYLDLAKQYHPDSGSKTADNKKFSQVETAYKTILRHRQKVSTDEKEETVESPLNQTAPQHRQYLNNEGIGFGTPSQRQKQYQQYKVQRAVETVHEYKTGKIAGQYETAMVTKDKQDTRKKKIQSSIERLVEDLIQESMAKGDFDNLPGAGKPLDYSTHNPYVDNHTHNLNKVLINNGYVPEWVTLDKDIKTEIRTSRDRILQERIKLGREPLSAPRYKIWLEHEKAFRKAVKEINKNVDKLNLSCPALYMQMMTFDPDREVKKVVDKYRELLEKGLVQGEPSKHLEVEYVPVNPKDQISFKDIWTELKSLIFTKS